jgi:hypothetical protein
MFRYLLICICIFLLHKDEVTIPWSDAYKLAWSDFQGPPKQDSDAVATTASGITFNYSIKKTSKRIVSFNTDVFAHFYPKKSWFKPSLADNHILSHEQYHFNITELFARKFRQRVAQIAVSESLSIELDQIHYDINAELSNFQEQYDAETNFSRDFEQQAIWQKRIDIELAKLESFQSKH